MSPRLRSFWLLALVVGLLAISGCQGLAQTWHHMRAHKGEWGGLGQTYNHMRMSSSSERLSMMWIHLRS